MRKVLSATIMTLTLLIVGCGGDVPGKDLTENVLYHRTVTIEDGRTIDCIIYSPGNRGVLSCDWGN